jgi:hypothetical protein
MILMRDFSWKYFTMTGDVDAYMLYKQISDSDPASAEPEEDNGEDPDEIAF